MFKAFDMPYYNFVEKYIGHCFTHASVDSSSKATVRFLSRFHLPVAFSARWIPLEFSINNTSANPSRAYPDWSTNQREALILIRLN